MNAGAVRSVRRNVRNVVHNYTDAQVKVREATSNDPWGPSSTLMSQIAEYSHNMVAFTDIMQMIWRRINDHGKNWRHVYKALVLLDYLIKAGNERVAQQCKENIFNIETLKDFQYFEENTDHGRAIRERAKQLVALLQDDERLKQERQRALKARERFLESNQGFGISEGGSSPTSPSERSVDQQRTPAVELEMARPQTSGEEELQLQLAIAMSQEEAEREKQRSRSDEVRLQMALKESQTQAHRAGSHTVKGDQSSMADLLALELGGHAAAAAAVSQGATAASGGAITADPWGMPAPAPVPKPAQQNDPWGSAATTPVTPADPWTVLDKPTPAPVAAAPIAAAAAAPAAAAPVDPWTPLASTPATISNSTGAAPAAAFADPWAPKHSTGTTPIPAGDDDEFAELTQRATSAAGAEGGRTGSGGSPWDISGLGAALTPSPVHSSTPTPTPVAVASAIKPAQSRSPHNFLGENSNLVNLDNLIGAPSGPSMGPAVGQAPGPPAVVANPFGWSPAATAVPANPFQAAAPPPPSINQIRNNRFEPSPAASTNPWNSPASAANPFLS